MSSEKIWYKDPLGFITFDNFGAVVPSMDMTYAQQMNAVLRLLVYHSVIVITLGGASGVAALPLVAAIATYAMYREFLEDEKEGDQREGCVMPTFSNPFMNVLVTDPSDRPPACDPLDERVSREVNSKYTAHLPYDGEKFQEDHSVFTTTPITTTPNDQTSFAEWCYGATREGGKNTRPPKNSVYG